MPQRDRTFMIVVTVIWILSLAAPLVIAAVGPGGEGEHDEDEHEEQSGLMLVEAPGSRAANSLAQFDPLAPADAPA